MGTRDLPSDMAKTVIMAAFKFKAVIANQHMIAFAVPGSNQPGSGLQGDGMHVTGLSCALDAFTQPIDLELGGIGQFAVNTLLQAIGNTAAQQVRANVRDLRSIGIAP